ncbi:hypothetical protein [Nodularia sp. UHCC 0506]|uniref:hypothetical protein n=1 Tax=Nodularia sp. UHCC 0506 TaxID=3110243 RepID=UPI002B1FBCAF|nr:hypothetical protein [Nodularia sp. UHCC 0506]MEA5515758.1 hypothetical protein [Nodularia sp. UHCC 0506]
MNAELAPLRELIVPKAKRPETTLSLVEALRKPVETVETYIFTDSIRAYFNQIFEEVVAERGQAFWIQAEYGAGKTHFLGTLASLLGEQPDTTKQEIWDVVSDGDIQNERFKIQPQRLLPVVFSLRGEGGQSGALERSLLDIIARETAKSWELQRDCHPGLPNLKVTTDDDLLEWYRNCGEGLRSDIERFVKAETSVTLAELRSEEGDSATAEQIMHYCQCNGIKPDVAISTKERVKHIYQQIHEAGYTGILLVMDEFAFWQDRGKTDEQRASDEETLETIGHVLPRDEGANIWVILASQKAAPTKLKGDRFKELSLLADRNQTDYYTIASRRIRDIQPHREPELNQYYDFYRNNFKFLRLNNISYEQFIDRFPFQPRAFDIIRRITRENLPSARFGIGVLFDLIKRGELLQQNRLIIANDLLKSSSLIDGFKDTLYEDSYRAYQEAKDSVKEFEIDPSERPIADNILGFLFLEHIAHLDSGIEYWLKISDIVEATLTQSDVLLSEDTIDSLLFQLRELSQIEYQSQKQVVGDRQARFISVESDRFNPIGKFRSAKGKIPTDEGKLLITWREIILASPNKTFGKDNLLNKFSLNTTASKRVIYKRVEYKQEVVLTDQWNSSAYGSQLDLDNHARIVILTYPGEIDSSEILDDRIAVVAPAVLTQSAKELIRDWLTVDALEEKYRNDATADGEKMREFLKEKRREIVPEIQKTQVDAYRKGKVFTRRSLGIKLSDIFRQATAEQAIESIAQKLLADAYTQPLINASEFKSGKNLELADVRKVFEGLLTSNPSVANRNAVENYGVGLGLTSDQNSSAFNPQNCQVFEILRQQLNQHQGRVTRTQIEKLLVASPYGLTRDLLSLYLMCFVHYGNPRAELELSHDNTIQLQNGTTPPKGRLTTDTIRQVKWSNKFDREIRVLQESVGVDWNQVVPFARILDDTLTTTTDSQQKLEQEERLKRACQALGQRVAFVDNSLRSLARMLGSTLPASVSGQLLPLQSLTQTSDLDNFFETAQSQFESEQQLAKILLDFVDLENLSHLSTDLGADRAYLRQLKDSLPFDADPLRHSLDEVLVKFNLEQMLESPSFQENLRSQLEQIKSEYINQYRIHHREHYQAVQTLRTDLAGAEEKLKTLERLNTLSELGLPVTLNHRQLQQALLNQLQVCSVTDLELQQGLAHDPLCGHCRLELRQSVPTDQVTAWQQDLNRAMIEQFARLKSETVKRLLRNAETEYLKNLLQVLESGNAEDLVGLLTDEGTQILQSLLQQANVVSATSDVLVQIRETYPTIERHQLREVVQAMELLLEAKFEELEQENRGKTVRINLE